MTTLTAIDWDKWRTDYPSMTFQDQKDFYAEVADLFPVQESYDTAAAHEVFDAINGKDLCVIELGGWNGKLAADLLPRGDILEWWNCDIVDVPQVCTHRNYHRDLLEDWMWASPICGDVFVACHTIEHLSRAHMLALVKALRTEWVYLEAPLAVRPFDWTGYPGSHKLDIGWEAVDRMLAPYGYQNAGWREAAQLDEFGEQAYTGGLWRKP